VSEAATAPSTEPPVSATDQGDALGETSNAAHAATDGDGLDEGDVTTSAGGSVREPDLSGDPDAGSVTAGPVQSPADEIVEEHHASNGEQEAGAAHQVTSSASVPSGAHPAPDGDLDQPDGGSQQDPSSGEGATADEVHQPATGPSSAAQSDGYGNEEQSNAKGSSYKPTGFKAHEAGRALFSWVRSAPHLPKDKRLDAAGMALQTLDEGERELLARDLDGAIADLTATRDALHLVESGAA
jgi:hypothetical protein